MHERNLNTFPPSSKIFRIHLLVWLTVKTGEICDFEYVGRVACDREELRIASSSAYIG